MILVGGSGALAEGQPQAIGPGPMASYGLGPLDPYQDAGGREH
jgi:hypothetical protein